MKKLLKEFLETLIPVIPVSIGATIGLLIFFIINDIDSQSMQENVTKTVDTVYVHDTIFIQNQ